MDKMKLLSLLLASASLLGSEQTLAIIKPDAVAGDHIGQIIERYESHGLKVKAMQMKKLSQEEAEKFYEVHRERPFYKDLTAYMASGDVVAIVLEGDNAVAKNRALMGATNPEQAEAGTIRKDFGKSVQQNAVHGSDSLENAQKEIAFFFGS